MDLFGCAAAVSNTILCHSMFTSIQVTEYAKGSHFGENALLEDEICLESVVASSEISLKVLSRSKFQALGLKSWKKRQAVRSVDSDPTLVNASLKKKSPEEAEVIKKLGGRFEGIVCVIIPVL